MHEGRLRCPGLAQARGYKSGGLVVGVHRYWSRHKEHLWRSRRSGHGGVRDAGGGTLRPLNEGTRVRLRGGEHRRGWDSLRLLLLNGGSGIGGRPTADANPGAWERNLAVDERASRAAGTDAAVLELGAVTGQLVWGEAGRFGAASLEVGRDGLLRARGADDHLGWHLSEFVRRLVALRGVHGDGEAGLHRRVRVSNRRIVEVRRSHITTSAVAVRGKTTRRERVQVHLARLRQHSRVDVAALAQLRALVVQVVVAELEAEAGLSAVTSMVVRVLD